jgi:hypothetical protein
MSHARRVDSMDQGSPVEPRYLKMAILEVAQARFLNYPRTKGVSKAQGYRANCKEGNQQTERCKKFEIRRD